MPSLHWIGILAIAAGLYIIFIKKA